MPEKLSVDRSLPIEAIHLEIADTFQGVGTKLIEESPEFLITKKSQVEDLKKKINLTSSKVN